MNAKKHHCLRSNLLKLMHFVSPRINSNFSSSWNSVKIMDFIKISVISKQKIRRKILFWCHMTVKTPDSRSPATKWCSLSGRSVSRPHKHHPAVRRFPLAGSKSVRCASQIAVAVSFWRSIVFMTRAHTLPVSRNSPFRFTHDTVRHTSVGRRVVVVVVAKWICNRHHYLIWMGECWWMDFSRQPAEQFAV